MGKICTKCKKDKELNEFGKKTSSKDGLRNDCKECRKIERKIYLEKNRKPKKEKIKLTEEEKKIKSHERYLKNKDKIKIRNKNWRLNNIEKVRDYKRRYVNQRYHSDPEYRFMWLIRTKINKVLKGTRKYKKTMELVGCTIEELKIYLENSRPCSRGTSRGISLVGYRSALVYCKDKTIILDCSWPGWTKYYCTEIFRIKTTP